MAEKLVERLLGEGVETSDPVKGAELEGLTYEAPFNYITDWGPRGRTVLPAEFVSVEDGTGVVHTGVAFGEDDFQLAQDYGLTVHNRVRPGRHLRRGDRRVRRPRRARGGRRHRRGAASVGAPVPRRGVRARLPALLALRHRPPLLRQVELARADHRAARRAAGRQRVGQLVPRPHQARAHGQVAREQRGLGALARALLGHAAADLEVRGRRGGLRRLAGRSCASWAPRSPTTSTGRSSTR